MTTCHRAPTVVSIILATTRHGGLRKDAAHVTRSELWMAAAEKNWAIGATVAHVQVMVHRGETRWNIRD